MTWRANWDGCEQQGSKREPRCSTFTGAGWCFSAVPRGSPSSCRSVMPSTRSEETGHIGIVAVSAEGAALCYRTICTEGAAILGPHGHPQVSMHTYPLNEYMHHLDAGGRTRAGCCWDLRGSSSMPAPRS